MLRELQVLSLDIGGNTETANYLSGAGTNTLKFRYIVKTGDNDNDGLTIGNSIDLTGATIQDLGTVDAIANINPPLTPYLYVNGNIPTIVNFTAPVDNNYTTGQSLDFIIEFSENVLYNRKPKHCSYSR